MIKRIIPALFFTLTAVCIFPAEFTIEGSLLSAKNSEKSIMDGEFSVSLRMPIQTSWYIGAAYAYDPVMMYSFRTAIEYENRFISAGGGLYLGLYDGIMHPGARLSLKLGIPDIVTAAADTVIALNPSNFSEINSLRGNVRGTVYILNTSLAFTARYRRRTLSEYSDLHSKSVLQYKGEFTAFEKGFPVSVMLSAGWQSLKHKYQAAPEAECMSIMAGGGIFFKIKDTGRYYLTIDIPVLSIQDEKQQRTLPEPVFALTTGIRVAF